LAEALLIALIFWSVFPRSYQIYEDHIRIVLGGPFSSSIRFEYIETVLKTDRFGLNVNFVTRFARNYVRIVRKKGTSVAITPGDYDMFIENAAGALNDWRSRLSAETGH
jgi:hypothetical protein